MRSVIFLTQRIFSTPNADLFYVNLPKKSLYISGLTVMSDGLSVLRLAISSKYLMKKDYFHQKKTQKDEK